LRIQLCIGLGHLPIYLMSLQDGGSIRRKPGHVSKREPDTPAFEAGENSKREFIAQKQFVLAIKQRSESNDIEGLYDRSTQLAPRK